MKGYLRDFWKQTSALGVIIPLVALGAISIGVGATDQPPPVISEFVDYYDQGFHLIFFVGGDTGAPIPHATLHVRISPQQTGPGFPPPSSTYSATTGTNGLANVFAPLVSANYTVTWFANDSAGSVEASADFGPSPTGIIQGNSLVFASARVGFVSTQGGLFVFFAGPYGKPVSDYTVQYGVLNTTGFPLPNVSSVKMTALGKFSGYYRTFPLAFAANLVAIPNLELVAQITAPNGTVVASTSGPNYVGGFFLSDFPERSGPTDQATRVVSYVTIVMATYASFVAVFVAFNQYGRDRVSRTLESVLWRPVTQPGLLFERYSSTAVAMVLVIGLSILLLDFGLWSFWKVSLPTSFALIIFGAMLATAMAFAGLVFLGSRFARSVGTLIGVGGGLLLIFIVLFTPVLLYLVGTTAGQKGIAVEAAFFNPVLLPALAIDATTNGFSPIGEIVTIPTPVLVSVVGVVIAGVMWVLAPLVLSLVHAQLRD